MHAVEDCDFDEYVACVDVKEQVCAVEKPDQKGKLLAVMLLNGHRVPFQLDTGAVSDICRLQTADCRLQTTNYRLHTDL